MLSIVFVLKEKPSKKTILHIISSQLSVHCLVHRNSARGLEGPGIEPLTLWLVNDLFYLLRADLRKDIFPLRVIFTEYFPFLTEFFSAITETSEGSPAFWRIRIPGVILHATPSITTCWQITDMSVLTLVLSVSSTAAVKKRSKGDVRQTEHEGQTFLPNCRDQVNVCAKFDSLKVFLICCLYNANTTVVWGESDITFATFWRNPLKVRQRRLVLESGTDEQTDSAVAGARPWK